MHVWTANLVFIDIAKESVREKLKPFLRNTVLNNSFLIFDVFFNFPPLSLLRFYHLFFFHLLFNNIIILSYILIGLKILLLAFFIRNILNLIDSFVIRTILNQELKKSSHFRILLNEDSLNKADMSICRISMQREDVFILRKEVSFLEKMQLSRKL